jgi:hypothetical protein
MVKLAKNIYFDININVKKIIRKDNKNIKLKNKKQIIVQNF